MVNGNVQCIGWRPLDNCNVVIGTMNVWRQSISFGATSLFRVVSALFKCSKFVVELNVFLFFLFCSVCPESSTAKMKLECVGSLFSILPVLFITIRSTIYLHLTSVFVVVGWFLFLLCICKCICVSVYTCFQKKKVIIHQKQRICKDTKKVKTTKINKTKNRLDDRVMADVN